MESQVVILNGITTNHLEKCKFTGEELVERLKEDFYVDDLVSGTGNAANAKIFAVRVS